MSEALHFALDTARQAGQLLCDFYHRQHTIQSKSTEIDLVTEADLASEQLIVKAIKDKFPDHSILSEEGQDERRTAAIQAPHLWLVDPLDGTVDYAHGYPFWGVALALAKRGQVVMGVTYDPLRDEAFWTERGQGAWCNGRRMQVSKANRLRDSLLATGFAYTRATVADNNLAEFSAVMPRVQGIRRAGAAVLDLAYVADGRLDGYWEMHLNPWDWATGSLLVQEAGGIVTGRRGRPWSLAGDDIVATNGHIHDALLALLREAQSG